MVGLDGPKSIPIYHYGTRSHRLRTDRRPIRASRGRRAAALLGATDPSISAADGSMARWHCADRLPRLRSRKRGNWTLPPPHLPVLTPPHAQSQIHNPRPHIPQSPNTSPITPRRYLTANATPSSGVHVFRPSAPSYTIETFPLYPTSFKIPKMRG